MILSNKYEMSLEENIFIAKRILVDSVYQQANLEGIGVTFADTQDILNNINVGTLSPTEISKVCCLRDGWEYLLSHIDSPTDLIFIENLHEIVARFDVPLSIPWEVKRGRCDHQRNQMAPRASRCRQNFS